MESSISKETFWELYELLDSVSPVDFDCGTLCDEVCCTCDVEACQGQDLVLYLFPGEEKLFTDGDWYEMSYESTQRYEYPTSWGGDVYFIRCLDPPHCDRKLRPIQCRTFPLAPHLDENGELHLIYEEDIPYVCPLIRDKTPLNEDFIEKNFEAWKILIEDPLIKDLIQMDSTERIENNVNCHIVI